MLGDQAVCGSFLGTLVGWSARAAHGSMPRSLSYVEPLVAFIPRRPHTQHLGSDPTQLTSQWGQYRAPTPAVSRVPDSLAVPLSSS